MSSTKTSSSSSEVVVVTNRKEFPILLRGESRQPYPSLEELLRARPYLHPSWPMERILHMGDLHAEVVDDFIAGKQYDAALREHVMASVIVQGIVPLHKEFVPIQADGNFLLKKFQDLEKRVMQQKGRMEEIKMLIKEDNERNGIKETQINDLTNSGYMAVSSLKEVFELLPRKMRTEPLLAPVAEPADYSPYKNRRGKFFRRGSRGVARRPPQLSMEDMLENDYDLSELSFTCENPSCWVDTGKFRGQTFAGLIKHYNEVHAHQLKSESFLCDYGVCSRFEDSFGRKDIYRDHLRDYHYEDIPKRHKSFMEEMEWRSQRVISTKWWRCAQCLIRVKPDVDEWSCPECKQPCEAERVANRRLKDAVGYDEKQDFSARRARQVCVGDEHRYRARLFLPAPKIVENAPTEASRLRARRTPSMKSLIARIVGESQMPLINPLETQDHLVGTDVRLEKQASAYDFCHTEYGHAKVVPYRSIRQLGRGSFGSVDAVRNCDDKFTMPNDDSDTLLARKLISLPSAARKWLLPIIQQEVAVLRGLDHQHIVKVLCTYETMSVPRQFGILLSPVGDEDLSHYLERLGEEDFPEEGIQRLQKWRYCLASAVAYIHSQYIRQRDIKPSNAICRGDEIFLTDFGSSRQSSADITGSTSGYAAGVTKMYSAPEVTKEERRGRPADIYSLGCVFAEMTTVIHGRRVEDFHEFRSEPDPEEPQRMTLCYYATAHKVFEWFKTDCDALSQQLITSMLEEDQRLRPTAAEILGILQECIPYIYCSCRTEPISGPNTVLSDVEDVDSMIEMASDAIEKPDSNANVGVQADEDRIFEHIYLFLVQLVQVAENILPAIISYAKDKLDGEPQAMLLQKTNKALNCTKSLQKFLAFPSPQSIKRERLFWGNYWAFIEGNIELSSTMLQKDSERDFSPTTIRVEMMSFLDQLQESRKLYAASPWSFDPSPAMPIDKSLHGLEIDAEYGSYTDSNSKADLQENPCSWRKSYRWP